MRFRRQCTFYTSWQLLHGLPLGIQLLSALLGYYFQHYNQGRTFFIAGHSQGSAMTSIVLQKYFKEHPDYYQRMVAAYVIGYAVTKDDLAANLHLKFATGESDTGVITAAL